MPLLQMHRTLFTLLGPITFALDHLVFAGYTSSKGTAGAMSFSTRSRVLKLFIALRSKSKLPDLLLAHLTLFRDNFRH
jgi:hypothetical protein